MAARRLTNVLASHEKSVYGVSDCIELMTDVLQAQLRGLTPLKVPRKPVGLKSQTGTVKIGDMPAEDEATQEDIHKLSRDTGKLLKVRTTSREPQDFFRLYCRSKIWTGRHMFMKPSLSTSVNEE